jgi:hypothetical protein
MTWRFAIRKVQRRGATGVILHSSNRSGHRNSMRLSRTLSSPTFTRMAGSFAPSIRGIVMVTCSIRMETFCLTATTRSARQCILKIFILRRECSASIAITRRTYTAMASSTARRATLLRLAALTATARSTKKRRSGPRAQPARRMTPATYCACVHLGNSCASSGSMESFISGPMLLRIVCGKWCRYSTLSPPATNITLRSHG